jgi:hypothetical protein
LIKHFDKILERIDWQYVPDSSQKDRQRSLYCLRTNLSDWDETRLWETYLMLTEIEATFRSLKTELGEYPQHHGHPAARHPRAANRLQLKFLTH